MRTWWVNQNQTYRQEQDGGYLWSPKRKANGHRNHFYDTMREVSPGDLVLAFQKTRIRAVGVVRSFCYESPKPEEFGTAGEHWNRIGWRVDVHWSQLQNQIRPSDHMSVLRNVLPGRYSPLRENGHGLQSVYLAEVPRPMVDVLANLVGQQLRVLVDNPTESVDIGQVERPEKVEKLKREWENHLEQKIDQDDRIPETDRIALVRSRRGQGLFRDRVHSIERACRITTVDNPTHLVASHITPWRHANNEARLDGENGLMLTPSVDHLFDRGFISFQDDGRLLVSPVADRLSLNKMGIETGVPVNVGEFSSGQRRHLEYHRGFIFLEAS
ncbi:MAG: HNH endonuclease [Proteobacteria bacterium]|nr:HNH endonuclease [Pseudomonadota bacterium]